MMLLRESCWLSGLRCQHKGRLNITGPLWWNTANDVLCVLTHDLHALTHGMQLIRNCKLHFLWLFIGKEEQPNPEITICNFGEDLGSWGGQRWFSAMLLSATPAKLMLRTTRSISAWALEMETVLILTMNWKSYSDNVEKLERYEGGSILQDNLGWGS